MCAQSGGQGRTRAGGAATRSTIHGRVVYADTGNPVRRAEVTLMDAGTGERIGGEVTDVKGEFNIRNLPAGRYYLSTAAPSLVDQSVITDSDVATDLLNLAEERKGLTEVTVNGASGADVLIRARRGGVITGRVTSEDDEPVVGAQLRLFRLRQGQLFRVASTWRVLEREKRYLTTDSRGVYRIGGLPPGEYVVRASESDVGAGAAEEEGDAYGDGSLVVSYFPSASSVKDAVPVSVYEGRDTDRVDIHMPERPTRSIGGTVTLRRGGFPVAGAEITVSRKDEGLPSRRGFGEESARTDADGRWEVRGVPDGEYVLTVNAIGAVATDGSGGRRSVRIVPASKGVAVSGTDLTGLKLELEEGVRVRGTVSLEGSKEFPQLLGIEAIRNGEEVDWTFVRDGGQFELDSVPAGEVRLRVTRFPEGRFYLKSVAWKGVDLVREPLRVGESADVDGVRVVLSANVATLKGQVFSRGNGTSPLGHALVVLVPADEGLRRTAPRPRVVRADATGRFEVAGGPGEYLIIALPEQAVLRQKISIDEDYIRRSDSSTLTRVTLRAGESVSGIKVISRAE